jgi:hypothetical protein
MSQLTITLRCLPLPLLNDLCGRAEDEETKGNHQHHGNPIRGSPGDYRLLWHWQASIHSIPQLVKGSNDFFDTGETITESFENHIPIWDWF